MERFDPDGTAILPDYPRSPLHAVFVGVMRLKLEARGLQLIRQATRSIRRHDVHELILTDEAAAPGRAVDAVAYLGFVEFLSGGIMAVGDEVRSESILVGDIGGFDDTHMPNHQNILVRGPRRLSGAELGIRLGQRVDFLPRVP
ncbi:MAG: hypothetical protein KIT81_13305 [Alphaproteobacteria bacterium]|nr:hypothetical protein [Alphaproteobacteria bacterium]